MRLAECHVESQRRETLGGVRCGGNELQLAGRNAVDAAYEAATLRFRPILMTSIATVLGAVPIAFATGADFGKIGGNDWWLMLLQVVVAGVMGRGSIAWANRYMDATLVALLGLGSPVLSSIFAWWIFEQSMTAVQILGAGVMLAAVGVVVARKI